MVMGMRLRAVVPATMAVLLLAGLAPAAAERVSDAPRGWIVLTDHASATVEDAVERLGGTVTLDLGLVSGLAVEMSDGAADVLATRSDVLAVIPDGSVALNSRQWESGDPNNQGSLSNINRQIIGATRLWDRGVTGAGVDIALIDSGVTPVTGLQGAKVVHGPDISFDGGFPNLANLDFYGHGTHLASIIAGNDGVDGPDGNDLRTHYLGVAPEARIVSIKVANAIGLADVSQVIAAIDWVVQNRTAGDLDIRVLALAFGTDSTQDYRIDPLSLAVEQAWKHGVVVVTSTGNDGNDRRLRNPATNPFVIAVGAVETAGTRGTGDDRVLRFSNCGTTERHADLVAPGRSVLGLRVPGSFIDSHYPEAVTQGRLFRGTGTSQAAAVVAGAAALLIDQRPDLTPDQVKALLLAGATPTRGSERCAGAGVLDVAKAARTATPNTVQTFEASTGTGSLEASRGSHHVSLDGVTLTGEQDWLGGTWSGGTWSGGTWSGGTWSGGTWSGGTWSGGTWSGGTWSGGTWSGGTWSGGTWSGGTWSGGTWSGGTWSGGTWSGGTWSGGTWSSGTWS
jgi:serine protease AprX